MFQNDYFKRLAFAVVCIFIYIGVPPLKYRSFHYKGPVERPYDQ